MGNKNYQKFPGTKYQPQNTEMTSKLPGKDKAVGYNPGSGPTQRGSRSGGTKRTGYTGGSFNIGGKGF